MLYSWDNQNPAANPVGMWQSTSTYRSMRIWKTANTQADSMAVNSFDTAATVNEAAGMLPTDTTVTVTPSATLPPTPFVALIDAEQVLVVNAATTTWSIERGYNGTTRAFHANGEDIQVEQANPKAIYVAFDVLSTQPKSTPQVAPVDELMVLGSADGGLTFSTLQRLSTNVDPNSTNPQILFSQGTTNDTVSPAANLTFFNDTGTSIEMNASRNLITNFFRSSSATVAAGVVTITAEVGLQLVPGETVTISGVDGNGTAFGYDGTFTVVATPAANQFTYNDNAAFGDTTTALLPVVGLLTTPNATTPTAIAATTPAVADQIATGIGGTIQDATQINTAVVAQPGIPAPTPGGDPEVDITLVSGR